MTMLTRWEPFREMRRIHDALDRVMDDSFYTPSRQESDEGLALVDMYETDDDVIVKAALPGVDNDDIDISISDGMLTIQAEIREDKEEHGEDDTRYYLREQRYKRFARSMRLPTAINADKAEAEYKNGVLRLTLPKAVEAKPKQITIKAK